MGCKCTNSNTEEKEINNKDISEENKLNDIYKNNEINNLNNGNKNDINNNYDNNYEHNNNNNNINSPDELINHLNYNNSNDNETGLNLNEYENNNNSKYLNYPEKIVEIINNIRQDPASYSQLIEHSIKYIIANNNKDDITKNKIIYKKKVKVALSRGEPAFREAAEELRKTEPLPPLEFSAALCIPLPDSEEDIKDSVFLKNQVLELRKEGIKIDVFFKDLVKIPEVSALLMIVDDNGKNSGKKRMTLLNRDFRYIGVNCKFIGKTFIAYLGFSK